MDSYCFVNCGKLKQIKSELRQAESMKNSGDQIENDPVEVLKEEANVCREKLKKQNQEEIKKYEKLNEEIELIEEEYKSFINLPLHDELADTAASVRNQEQEIRKMRIERFEMEKIFLSNLFADKVEITKYLDKISINAEKQQFFRTKTNRIHLEVQSLKERVFDNYLPKVRARQRHLSYI